MCDAMPLNLCKVKIGLSISLLVVPNVSSHIEEITYESAITSFKHVDWP